MDSSLIYALILSGGSGRRFGSDLPKQFAEIYGKTVLDYCISNFNNHPLIDKIIVISNPEHIQRTKQIANRSKSGKIVAVLEGGTTRGESSYIGLKEILNQESETSNIKVLIHDSVRPNTSDNIINEVIEQLNHYNAITIAIPTTDTIYITNEDSVIQAIPDRNHLLKAQTPQGFKFDKIMAAYEKLDKIDQFIQTDDICVIKKVFPDENIIILDGDINNIKITFLEDIEYFRQVMQNKNIK